MLNGVGRLSSVSTTNVCRRDGDVEYSNCEAKPRRHDENEVSVKTFNNKYDSRENIIVVNDPFLEK